MGLPDRQNTGRKTGGVACEVQKKQDGQYRVKVAEPLQLKNMG